MKFDFCIGNPPYQKMDGIAETSATPIYQYFSTEAKKIARINCIIEPARWMTGGKSLDNYRKEMLDDKSIKVLYDYADSKNVFSGVDIKGGVCIYLRDENYTGECECHRLTNDKEEISRRFLQEEDTDIFIRDEILVNIKNKVKAKTKNFITNKISVLNPYGLNTDAFKNRKKYNLPEFLDTPVEDGYRILGLDDSQKRTWKYVSKDYPIPKLDGIDKYKIFISEAYGCGSLGEVAITPVLGTPIIGTPTEACTGTFVQIGPFDTEEECKNFLNYIKTKFFRTLVGIKKQTQHATAKVYEYVPEQDFTDNSDIDWTKNILEIDEQLFLKYNLDNDEKQFIKEKIKEME